MTRNRKRKCALCDSELRKMENGQYVCDKCQVVYERKR